MKEMGFGKTWLNWIQQCISTAKAAVLVNGSPTKEFQLGRGLRQGIPLSPFLFNIVVEALSQLLQKAKALDFIEGVNVNRIRIIHL